MRSCKSWRQSMKQLCCRVHALHNPIFRCPAWLETWDAYPPFGVTYLLKWMFTFWKVCNNWENRSNSTTCDIDCGPCVHTMEAQWALGKRRKHPPKKMPLNSSPGISRPCNTTSGPGWFSYRVLPDSLRSSFLPFFFFFLLLVYFPRR